MKTKTFFISKAYFVKMVGLMSAAILVIVVVFSVASYTNAKKLLIEVENDANQKILFQVKYNLQMMNNILANLTKFLYVNSDLSTIMYAKEEDMVAVTSAMNRLTSSIQSSNPYFHSLIIYNSELEQFYSAGIPTSFDQRAMSELWKTNAVIPKLTPLFHDVKKIVNEQHVSEFVFSYFIYESSPQPENPPNMLMVNIKPDWLLDNIKQIHTADKGQVDSVFVMDRQGRFIDYGLNDTGMMGWLKRASEQHLNQDAKSKSESKSDGFFEESYKGAGYLVTYTHIESLGLTLFKVKPVLEVFKFMNQMKSSFLIITFIILAAALVLSYSVSHRIYRPLGRLIHSIQSGRQSIDSQNRAEDEISYLGSVYKESTERLDSYHREKREYKIVMKNYWLNRLLTESLTIERAELSNLLQEMNISLAIEGSHVIVVMKIDNFKAFKEKYSVKERETLRLALINITSEWIGKQFPNEGLDMGHDHVVLMVSMATDERDSMQGLIQSIVEAQETFFRHYKLMFTASISDVSTDIRSLNNAYSMAVNQVLYRFILGHGSILTSASIQSNKTNNGTGYSKTLENQLIESLQLRNFNKAELVLSDIFDEVAELSYYHALAAALRLADVMRESLNISMMKGNVVEYETIVELRTDMVNAFHSEENSQEQKSKNHFAVDAVTEYIHNHFDDPDLCLPSIAELMKIPARRLSKLYKEATGNSIPELIQEVRLIRASELISSGLSVHEVSKSVGIVNDTYFFSLFKKRFGMTPKEYALQKNVISLGQR